MLQVREPTVQAERPHRKMQMVMYLSFFFFFLNNCTRFKNIHLRIGSLKLNKIEI